MRRAFVLLGWGLVSCATESVELFPLDQSGVDAASDGAMSACTCRFVRCRTDPDCASFIGPVSTCGTDFVCSGASSMSCAVDGDCDVLGGPAGSWRCTAGPASTDACP